jgi:hypothetical protein
MHGKTTIKRLRYLIANILNIDYYMKIGSNDLWLGLLRWRRQRKQCSFRRLARLDEMCEEGRFGKPRVGKGNRQRIEGS